MEKPMLLAGAAMADILVENRNYIYSYLTEKKNQKISYKTKTTKNKQTNLRSSMAQHTHTHTIPLSTYTL